MTLQEYWDELEAHDWFYHFSDSGKVFNKGKANEDRLLKLRETCHLRGRLHIAFEAHKYSGPTYGTTKAPKPDRPGGPRDVPKSNVPF